MDWIVGSGSIFPSVLINRKFSNTRATYFLFDFYISNREVPSIKSIELEVNHKNHAWKYSFFAKYCPTQFLFPVLYKFNNPTIGQKS